MIEPLETQALNALEALEDPLLAWGVVDGGLTEEELLDALDSAILQAGEFGDPVELAELLQDRGLILRDDSVSPPLWRTRNGEALRLLARLRQFFLGKNPETAWRGGARLVADYRYARRPRAYPRRDMSWHSPLEDSDQDVYREALRLLTSQATNKNFDLSGFQVRATRQILASLQGQTTSATVVGAGTGSGKTLAFYLPAFAYLAAIQDSSQWTRALAVYPRNELLRDQFSTAFANARKLDDLVRKTSGRPLTMAVLNGDTPETHFNLKQKRSAWKRSSQGYRCPNLVCPDCPKSTGILYWPHSDAESGKERLVCGSCQRAFESDVIVLTRRRMRELPPDLLFTTTEMLNRNISNLDMRHVLGIGVSKKPRLMLLDEIHTYEGTTGAQAAMTIRRWHHGVLGPVTFVGLSATLADAVRHFADLTGLADKYVSSVEPLAEEMEYEGAEYMIAIRSDPTSGASVLSTTIQTSMLLPRVLDAPSVRRSKGTLGTKAFVFTDDLDVTNRLFSDLLDAEGQHYFENRIKQVKAPLASMRVPLPDAGGRRQAGQSWDLPHRLGHQFETTGLKVTRTTSQDAGVDRDSQLIVATASLEVGFDDPDVGAVVQHKAPRGVASFLQRKGRAGRTRGMRPYTAVVLSDYGRDRATYESWDRLFDPVLPQLVLPIANRAVVRMQATLATLDWVADQLSSRKPHANLWRDLSPVRNSAYGPAQRETQLIAIDLLERVLRDPALQHSLRKWIEGALGLSYNVVNEILWHPPRAVILAAIPTLVRRLRSEWAVAAPEELQVGRDILGGSPLPDFFPANLFSELSLTETNVLIPPQRQDATEPDVEAMGMTQMLREFAPGRISRRFAKQNLSHRHWVPIPTDASEADLDITTVLPAFRRDSDVFTDIDDVPTTLQLIQPDRLRVELAPKELKDSSNALLTWATQVTETGVGLDLRIPTTDPIGSFVKQAKFHLHAQNSHVEVRRAALQAEASLMMANGAEQRVRTRFELHGQRVALGSTFDVDGMSLRFHLPATIEVPASAKAGVKSAWFRHIFTTDPILLEHVNSFQITWLFEAIEAMLLSTAVDKQCSLEIAYAEIRTNFSNRLHETLRTMFRSSDTDDESDSTMSKLGTRLKELLNNPAVVSRLDLLVEQAWKPEPVAYQSWLHLRALCTLGQAALWAAREICPEHDPESLTVDVEPGLYSSGSPRRDEVWITEASIGGGGFIEALAARVRPDPRRFLRLIARALEPGTAELVDAHMQRLIKLIDSESTWSAAIASFRAAPSQEQRVTALDTILRHMRKAGIHGAEQSVVSCMANRLLRPGSTTQTDSAINLIISEWRQEEERLMLEIPSRTWAYLMRERSDLDAGLSITGTNPKQHRIDAVQSVLWPRGWAMRGGELESYNPYAKSPASAPDIVRAMVKTHFLSVDITEPAADMAIRQLLATHGSAQLSAPPGRSDELSLMLVGLTTKAIETDFLQVFPRVTEMRHLADGTAVVSLELAELAV